MTRDEIKHLISLWGTEAYKESEKEILLPCPFAPTGVGHKNSVDRHPNFSIRIDDAGPSVCYCFACNKGGRVDRVAYDLWETLESEQFKAAWLYARKVNNGASFNFDNKKPDKKPLSPDKAVFATWQLNKGKISSVLHQRGITDQDVKKWQLGYDPVEARDIFPVFDIDKRLIGLSGRVTDNEHYPKYWHYGAAQSPRIFYGEQFLDLTKKEVILVEGQLDTIKASRYFPNVLGQFGVEVMPPEKVRRLSKWFSIATLLYDGDAAGREGTFQVGLCLTKALTVFVAFLPEGLDPFDASADQLRKAMQRRILWSLVDWAAKEVEPKSKKKSH